MRALIELARAMKAYNEQVALAIDYYDQTVSVKVIKFIQSDAKIINFDTWRNF